MPWCFNWQLLAIGPTSTYCSKIIFFRPRRAHNTELSCPAESPTRSEPRQATFPRIKDVLKGSASATCYVQGARAAASRLSFFDLGRLATRAADLGQLKLPISRFIRSHDVFHLKDVVAPEASVHHLFHPSPPFNFPITTATV